MAWYNLFSGPSAESLEKKGDDLIAAGLWGQAKLEYERAYRKNETATNRDHESLNRIEGKIAGAREALAREHHQNAAHLAAIGDVKEALELVELALLPYSNRYKTLPSFLRWIRSFLSTLSPSPLTLNPAKTGSGLHS